MLGLTKLGKGGGGLLLSVNQLLLISFVLLFVWSGIRPYNRLTWWLETVPALLFAIVLVLVHRWFRLTTLSYILLWVQGALTLVGGHYSYPRVPCFTWLKKRMRLQRNHFDRLVHCGEGVVQTMIGRELLIRLSPVKSGLWLFLLVMAINLAGSAITEIVEFVIGKWKGRAAEDYLGMQGDAWDTQWDMALALVAGLIAYFLLGPIQSQQIGRLM
jgi:putative membrane protein